MAKVFPRKRGPRKEPVKVPLKLRVDPDVVAAYQSTGKGGQTLMKEDLRRGKPA